jgi:hypothetical protein
MLLVAGCAALAAISTGLVPSIMIEIRAVGACGAPNFTCVHADNVAVPTPKAGQLLIKVHASVHMVAESFEACVLVQAMHAEHVAASISSQSVIQYTAAAWQRKLASLGWPAQR